MRLLFLLPMLLGFLTIKAQNNPDFEFARYLIQKEQYPEAIFILKGMSANDSVNYLIGKSFYNLRKLDSAVSYFESVSQSSDLYLHTNFYRSFSYTYLKDFSKAKGSLLNIKISEPTLYELKVLNLAGIALLERNYSSFENYKNQFTYSDFNTSEEQRKLIEIKDQLQQVRSRSPLMAGVLSTVVPGSGKIYAGKWKQGLASFGIISILGLQWFETYRKRGIDNPYFYLYGSAFTLFYIGNIWGSVLSVQIEQNEQYKTLDNNIIFNLQLPLRTILQ